MNGRAGLFAVWAVALTGAIGLATGWIERTYLDNFPYFYDPVQYSYHAARLHSRLGEEGRLALAVREWLGNDRNPLRTVPLILFAPRLLAHPLGHMATALPAFGLFLFLLGFTVWRRSGSTAHGLASAALVCGVAGLYDPTLGLAANWLDLTASFLIGSAGLCLLNTGGARDRWWLAAFAALSALAALSRYVAAVFAAVACGPLLALYLADRWRRERRLATAVLAPLGLVAVVIAVLAGYFLVAHLPSNVFYYSALAYGIGHGPAAAAHFLLRFFGDYLLPLPRWERVLCLVTLAAAAAVQLAALWRSPQRRWREVGIALWLAGGIPLFLILVLRAPADPSVALYCLPGAIVAMATPATAVHSARARRALDRLAVPLLLLAIASGARAFAAGTHWTADPAHDGRFNTGWVTHSHSAIASDKAFDVALGDALGRQGEGLVWSAFFDETGPIHTMEAFTRSGVLILATGPRYFSIHDAYWRGFYPGLTADRISERVYAAASRWVDVAVVLDEPSRAEGLESRINRHASNAFTRHVARDVAGRIASDPGWRRVFVVPSERYGPVVGYRNPAAAGRGYPHLLRGHTLVSSPIDP